jgi:hypothetical protein
MRGPNPATTAIFAKVHINLRLMCNKSGKKAAASTILAHVHIKFEIDVQEQWRKCR